MWAAPPLCKGADGAGTTTVPYPAVHCKAGRRAMARQWRDNPSGATMPCQSGAGDYSAPAAGSGGPRCVAQRCGGMAEWLMALAWKACIRETVSWVRIPLPPPGNGINSFEFNALTK
jgi:hypothetical protein